MTLDPGADDFHSRNTIEALVMAFSTSSSGATLPIGLRGPQVELIVGAMLAIDRPLDMYRTAINIFGDVDRVAA